MIPKLNRRQFLSRLLLAAGGLVAGRCSPERATPTRPAHAATRPATAPPTDSAPAGGGSIQLTILHINDLHGALYASAKGDRELGGAAQLAGLIEEERASAPGPVLLLDAGDTCQGTYISNRSRGEAVFEILNTIGVDAMALGNHEFDWGLEVLEERIRQAQFPVLAANLEAVSNQPLESMLPRVRP